MRYRPNRLLFCVSLYKGTRIMNESDEVDRNMTRNTRIAVSEEELAEIKAAKQDVYGAKADDRPHAEFLVEAAERYAKAARLAE